MGASRFGRSMQMETKPTIVLPASFPLPCAPPPIVTLCIAVIKEGDILFIQSGIYQAICICQC